MKSIYLNDTEFCFAEFSTKIHWNTCLAASEYFHMFIHQLSSFNSIIVQMPVKCDSSNLH